ncbi:MAG TPA: hypothetical protein VJ853_01790 [Thermoanaerobaculia bacterium]|nr:hypothetical protein [Thermoanaerobaculia bacterium]
MVGSPGRLKPALTLDFDYDLFIDTSAIRRGLRYEERASRADAIAASVAWERR